MANRFTPSVAIGIAALVVMPLDAVAQTSLPYHNRPVATDGASGSLRPSANALAADTAPALKGDVAALQGQINSLAKRLTELQNELAQARQAAQAAQTTANDAQNWIGFNGPKVLKVVNAYPNHYHLYGMARLMWQNNKCWDNYKSLADNLGGGGVPCSYVTQSTADYVKSSAPDAGIAISPVAAQAAPPPPR